MRGFTCLWEAHSFTRYRTSYPTLPLFPVFRKLIPPSDIFEVKIWRDMESTSCLIRELHAKRDH